MQLQPKTKFFQVAFPKSVREWLKSWCYASGLKDDLPIFVNEPLKRLGSWALEERPSGNTQELVDAIAHPKDRGLLGEHILGTWVDRRMLPLAARASLLYAYTRREDPMWVSAEELS